MSEQEINQEEIVELAEGMEEQKLDNDNLIENHEVEE